MIATSTLRFLSALKKNNHKEWFDAHKEDFKSAQRDFSGFIEEMIGRISAFDGRIGGIGAKDCVFRIYNDVRFHKDKPPYKTHFGAFISPDGKNASGPGYYFHLEPGGSFCGGGVYMTPPDALQRIREDIAGDATRLKKILGGKEFRKHFRELWREGALKTAPKGFPKDHPDLALLQLKHFIADTTFADKDVTDAKFAVKLAGVFRSVLPLNDYLAEFL